MIRNRPFATSTFARVLFGAGLSALVLSAGACTTTSGQGKTRVLDADQDDGLGGTGTESTDIRSIAERMAREIVGVRWPETGEVPRIALLPVENHTRFRVDPKVIQNKLLVNLVKYSAGRVVFLPRDSEAQVMAEREKKRAGMYDQGEKAQAMAGADYLLKGEMRSLSKSGEGGVSDYITYTFQLINAETGAALWAGDYETKKAAETSVVYQ